MHAYRSVSTIITAKALDALAGSTTTANFFTTPGDLYNLLATLRPRLTTLGCVLAPLSGM